MKIVPGPGGSSVAAKSQTPKVMYCSIFAALALAREMRMASREMSVATMRGISAEGRSSATALSQRAFQKSSGVVPSASGLR